LAKLNHQQYLELRRDAKVLANENDGHGDKVLRLRDGKMLKLFRLKSLFSSALFKPYSKRFLHNALALQKLGVPTITGLTEYHIPSIKRTAALYDPLPGDTLRDIIQQDGGLSVELAQSLGKFFALLHQLGIYFRSTHLGNIVYTPDKQWGLIDVADMRFYNRSLPMNLRLRNFQHLCRYHIDATPLLATLSDSQFILSYIESAVTQVDSPKNLGEELIAALPSIKPKK